MKQEKIIDELIADLQPVRTIRPFALAVPVFLALLLIPTALIWSAAGARPNWHEALTAPPFIIESLAIIALTIVSLRYALASRIPGYAERVLYPTAISILAVWLISILSRAIFSLALNGDLPPAGPDRSCIVGLLLMGTLPALGLVLILKRGAPTNLARSSVAVGLAAFGGAALGMQLFCADESAMHLLTFHAVPVLVFALLTAAIGRLALKW